MSGSKYAEIGSEFWISEVDERTDSLIAFDPSELGFAGDSRLLLSGRTAIDWICSDIQAISKRSKVYMPAYCCDSMIYPFINRGFSLEFYDMELNGNRVQYLLEEKEFDIFYLNNYFGFPNTIDGRYLLDLKNKGVTIIYDCTHSLLMSDDLCKELADYTFASIRKWSEVATGAIVSKKNGCFQNKTVLDCPYADSKIDGMKLKGEYIHGNHSVEKSAFFEKFGIFNESLSENYQNYSIDRDSFKILCNFDFARMRQKRNENSRFLYDSLKNLGYVFPFGNPEDCSPLFLPIFFSLKEERDSVRSILIKNNIYCPVHWPKHKYVTLDMKANEIYDRELSLICDQRYGLDEMEQIVEILKIYRQNEYSI